MASRRLGLYRSSARFEGPKGRFKFADSLLHTRSERRVCASRTAYAACRRLTQLSLPDGSLGPLPAWACTGLIAPALMVRLPSETLREGGHARSAVQCHEETHA